MKDQELPPLSERPPQVDPYGAAGRSASELAKVLSALGDTGGAARATREAREALAKAALYRQRTDRS